MCVCVCEREREGERESVCVRVCVCVCVHLVVAAPARVELAAHRAHQLRQPPLVRRVDVLSGCHVNHFGPSMSLRYLVHLCISLVHLCPYGIWSIYVPTDPLCPYGISYRGALWIIPPAPSATAHSPCGCPVQWFRGGH